MGGACGVYGGEEKCVRSFGNLKGGDNLEDVRIDGDRIKIIFNEIRTGAMNWISQALDRDSWRAVVNTVMNKVVFLNENSSKTSNTELREMRPVLCA
jgi:hypothetical protein